MKISTLIYFLIILVFSFGCQKNKKGYEQIQFSQHTVYQECGDVQPMALEEVSSKNTDLENIRILISNLQIAKQYEKTSKRVIDCYKEQVEKD